MELIQKFRADLEKIDRIEPKFFRDLIALLYSKAIQHPLIPNELVYSFQTEENFDALFKWLAQVQHLPIPSQEKYLPLGKYAETLLLFYLENNQDFNLLAHSLQLNEEKITLGELDYLFVQHERELPIHLELAIKFYLKVDRDGKEVYLGPSTKDWMKRKLTKLLTHQLQLPQQRKELLPISLQKLNFKSHLYLKGALFLPYLEWKSNRRNLLNCGWWVSHKELEQMLNEEHQCNIITDKTDWIFPFNSRLACYQKEEVLKQSKQLLQERNEVMLCRYDANKQLLDRGFVVRANWPHERL